MAPSTILGHKRGQKRKKEAQSPGWSGEVTVDLARWDLFVTLIIVTSVQCEGKTCPKWVTKRTGNKGVKEY